MPLYTGTNLGKNIPKGNPQLKVLGTFTATSIGPNTVAVPAVSNGDLMLAFGLTTQNSGIDHTLNAPAAWTAIPGMTPWDFTGANGLVHMYMWYRWANAEPATYDFTFTGSGSNSKMVIAAFSGCTGIASTKGYTGITSGGSTTLPIPSGACQFNGGLMVVMLAMRGPNTTATHNAALTEILETNLSNGPQMNLAIMNINSPTVIDGLTATVSTNLDINSANIVLY